MKRKLLQLGFMALSGAIILSSCAKDYDEDIDDLKNQVTQNSSDITALKASMNSGKLIKTVVPNTAGFLVTFSDNSTISLLNGTAGATGFVPVLSIDANGYWTVKTSSTGTATQITDASGNPLKVTGAPGAPGANGTNGADGADGAPGANGTNGADGADGAPGANGTNGTNGADGADGAPGANGTNGADGKSPYIDVTTGNWFAWDSTSAIYKDTGVKAEGNTTVTTEVINSQLWVNGVNTGIACPGVLYNATLRSYTFTIPKVGGGVESFEIMQMSEALVMLTSITSPLDWGYFETSFGEVVTGGTLWDGVTYTAGQLLRSSKVIKLPIMVSPSNANLDLYNLELVYAKNTTLIKVPISAENISISAGYDAGKDGLFTRASSETGVWTVALSTTDEEFRALQELDNKLIAIKATLIDKTVAERSLTTKYEYHIGTNQEYGVDLYPSYTRLSDIGTTLDVLEILSDTPFYKSKITIDPLTPSAIKNAITITDGTITSRSDDASIATLNTKEVKFKVETIDFKGVAVVTELKVVFGLMYVSTSPLELAEKSHVINPDDDDTEVDETMSTIAVADLITKMGNAKYTEWAKNTSGLTVSIVKKSDHVSILNGVTVELKDGDGTMTTSPKDLKSLVITVNPALAVQTSDYQIEMKYNDPGDFTKNFEVYIPLKLTNPVLNMSTLFVQNPVYFLNNAVSIYGTDFAAAINDANLSAFLPDNYTAYPASGYFGFEYDGQKNLFGDPEMPRVSPLTSVKDVIVGKTTMGITYNIDLYYYHFGNQANKQFVQTIKVTPKSAIANGAVKKVASESTMTNKGGAKSISSFFEVEDVNENKLDAFKSTRKARIQSVEVVSSDQGMILIEQDGNDFTMTPNSNNTEMVDNAIVNLTITVTDVYGQKLVKTVPMTVTK